MKTRTTLSREMTINCGNFSNIKPSVSISLVHKLEDTEYVYARISGMLDSLMALETLALTEEMESISQAGWGHYKEELEKALDEINNTLTNHIRVLCGILGDE